MSVYINFDLSLAVQAPRRHNNNRLSWITLYSSGVLEIVRPREIITASSKILLLLKLILKTPFWFIGLQAIILSTQASSLSLRGILVPSFYSHLQWTIWSDERLFASPRWWLNSVSTLSRFRPVLHLFDDTLHKVFKTFSTTTFFTEFLRLETESGIETEGTVVGNLLPKINCPNNWFFSYQTKTNYFVSCQLRNVFLTSLTARSDSPTHLLNNSGPFTAMKLSPLSVASALAIRVLLQPGGPYIKIPLGGRIPILVNA